MNRRSFLVRCLISGGILGTLGKWLGLDSFLSAKASTTFGKSGYYRIVVLGDPHLPVREREVKNADKRQRILDAKDDVIEDINAWEDVNEVTVLGDIAAQFGVDTEYTYAEEYFSRLIKPVNIISGNHDYVYEDDFSPEGKFVYGDAASRERKLDRFKEIFGLDCLYYSQQAGPYQLIYLAPDSLGRHLTEIGEEQINWLKEQLQQHKDQPTIIFFHAPLKGTLLNYNKTANTPNFVAQPESGIDQILKENTQVYLWVSGHTHTPATNESYASAKINTCSGHVQNIHTPDMDRETIWTNSLYLYSDRIVVRTFNHNTKQWEEALERTIFLQ